MLGRFVVYKTVALALIFLWSSAGTASAFQSVVKRTTLLVGDIERSVEFYKAIGFDIWLDRGGDRDPNSQGGLPLNGKPSHSHITIMSGQHPEWAMIGLLEFSNPPLAWTRDEDDLTIGTSDAVLVIVTDDIKQVHENLLALDARILEGPRDYTSNSVEGRKFGAIMFFQDPDGHVIEMSQVFRMEPYEEAAN